MSTFLAMTPAERKAMPLQQSSTLWAQVMTKDLAEFKRLSGLGEAPPLPTR
jgi:hypothetical protein